MKPLISIIVNIYNLDFKYVKRSIESVKNQVSSNFECLIIDDGSSNEFIYKDFYKEICKDKRFKYYFHKNKGISLSRNKGIEISKGNYIFFLDGDDFLTDDKVISYMEKVIKKNKNSDIFHFNFEEIINELENNKIANQDEKFITYKNDSSSIKLIFFTQIQSMKCMYKNEFIKNNKLFFYNDRKRNEDVYFHLITKTLANEITFCNRKIYFYDTLRQNSISNTENKKNVHKEFIYYCIKAFEFLNPSKKSMFFLYVIYYQYQFLGNNFNESYKYIFFKNNYFIKNRIGVSIKDILINKLLWRNKISRLLKSFWEWKKTLRNTNEKR